ncbi:hypothetical protein H5410_022213 [Solanum commersonii]|uniref:Uncharacterized protein n=1 Tax=Solanum commersonii TaxID=4109 RepID=A0A9J5ZHE9_SOLCO|nr:hypothetical protein H5410_022213 [Solanum commersonii]
MNRTEEAESNGKNIVVTINAFDCLANETQQVQIVVENYEPVSMQTSDKVDVQQSQIRIPMKKQIDTMNTHEDIQGEQSKIEEVDKTTNLKDEKLAQENNVQQSTVIANVEYPIPLQMISTSPQKSSDCITMENKEHLPMIH